MRFKLILKAFFTTILVSFFLVSCVKFKKVDQRQMPDTAKAKARKNIEEGRGVSIGGLRKGIGGGTNYEFSSSNPMWRASLEILDFLPLTTVDYSGGMIITDWYTDQATDNESIKITIRFLSNEIRSDSLKIVVHRKICKNNNCVVNLLRDTKIKEELYSSILRKAAVFEKELKKKK